MPRQRTRYPPHDSPAPAPAPDRRAPARPHYGYGATGIGVDAHGGPVIDPTANVLALVEAANQRQDDLREMNNARIDAELRNQENTADLRAKHQEAIDTLEAKRLDAVRNVDQLAAKTEADRSAAAVTALANAAALTAETLRSAVNTSATNLATQLTNTVNAITERIAALEKSSYTGQGKQAVVDPQVTEMLMEMRALRVAQANDVGKQAVLDPAIASTLASISSKVDTNERTIVARGGRSEGMDTTWKLLIAGVGLLVALNALGVFRTAPVVAPSAAPQVIYVPSPPGTLLPSTPPATVPR